MPFMITRAEFEKGGGGDCCIQGFFQIGKKKSVSFILKNNHFIERY